MRDNFDIVILGDRKVGKTSITRHLMDKPFDSKYSPTHFGDFNVIRKDNFTWRISEPTDVFSENLFGKPSHALYCIDFSKAVNEQKINEELAALREKNPELIVILVATKSDLHEATDLEERLNALTVDAKERIVISIKNEVGLEKIPLFLLPENKAPQPEVQVHNWDQSLRNLNQELKIQLNHMQKELLKTNLNNFRPTKENNDLAAQLDEISAFIRQLDGFIQSDYSTFNMVMTSITLGVVFALIVAGIALLVGATPLTTSVTSIVCGVLYGGLRANSLFKESKAISGAVDTHLGEPLREQARQAASL